ncbi:four helix bundle protein [Rhodohalobacter sp. 614A]|uniref:four helix bundle protein n=1 Tax=Rhodohalobacter sp. 614A TaxID=2908649 RepID=UPI001F401D81|nr:four helix bundle protein [Rhodohalobacter sp. 614A]
MKQFSFEKLDVWQKATDFITDIYSITESFPDTEKYGLTSQIRRASVSIASNIAEGSSRKTPRDKARFYNIAYSTAIEVLNQLIIAEKLNMLDSDKYRTLREDLEEITRMLNGLHKSTNSQTKDAKRF